MLKVEHKKLFQKITDRYSSKILNWAISKTQSRPEGEDLAQEVLYQVFIGVSKEKEIRKLENFVWKVAYFVWCNRLRSSKLEQRSVRLEEGLLPDEYTIHPESVLEKIALEEELKEMRKKIANLSKLQREIMILYYLNDLSVCEVAKQLGTKKSTVKWHLFDARNRIRKGFEYMKDNNSYVYSPGKLGVAISGNSGPDPDTKKIPDSMIKQNLCLLCYHEGKTIDDLIEYTAVPRPYLEFELDWLIKREFMKKEGTKYYTSFSITDKMHHQRIGGIFNSFKKEYIDVLLQSLVEKEKRITNIGFHGLHFPFGRTLWSLIMLYCDCITRKSNPCIRLGSNNKRPIRPDGGNYYPLGYNYSNDQEIDPDGWQDHENWQGINGIQKRRLRKNEWVYWLGVYTFTDYKFEFTQPYEKLKNYHNLFCSLIKPDFDTGSLNPEKEEQLAITVKNGWVKKIESEYRPEFLILKHSEFERLEKEIFIPIIKQLEPLTEKLISIFISENKKALPPQVRTNIEYLTYMDFYMLLFYTLMFGVWDGILTVPESKEVGALYTLVMTYDG